MLESISTGYNSMIESREKAHPHVRDRVEVMDFKPYFEFEWEIQGRKVGLPFQEKKQSSSSLDRFWRTI